MYRTRARSPTAYFQKQDKSSPRRSFGMIEARVALSYRLQSYACIVCQQSSIAITGGTLIYKLLSLTDNRKVIHAKD